MKSIKEEARSVGLSLEQLAALLGINRSTLHRWHKRGRKLAPYKREIVRSTIAKIRDRREGK